MSDTKLRGRSEKKDKSLRGTASQFFVAGELCRRGLVAVVTLGNCPNTDILCSNLEGTRFVHIQVKTFRPGSRTCTVGLKAEKDYGANFFWVLGGIPEPKSKIDFVYYVIPSRDMAKNVKKSHQLWKNTPGKHGQQHDPENKNKVRTVRLPPASSRSGWNIMQYENRWGLIEKKLK
jgi:hypothetical protein